MVPDMVYGYPKFNNAQRMDILKNLNRLLKNVVKEGLLIMYHTVSPTVCGDANIRVVNVKVSYNYKYSEYN